jgi:glycosyltransferase involved in cell wall biosynthesis
MTIIHPFPPTLAYSPYLDDLYGVLEPHYTIDRRSPRRAIPALLFGRGARILHVHFFDEVVQRPSKFTTWFRYIAWIMLLMLLRWRGVTIVWTVHNATPHECMHPDIARRTTQHVLNQCHAVTVHHHATRTLLLEQYRTTTPISVIPHGHTAHPFGLLPHHQYARQQLGLTLDAPLLLYLGMIRRYKGIETLIDAMELLPHAHLVIAGHAADTVYLSEIHQHTARRINVTIRPRFLPDHEAAQYLAACDLLVLPYRSITTSGMLVAAQAAGIVCVVPNLPPLLEQVRDGVTGFVFHADNSNSLIHTIERALANPNRRQIGSAAQRALANHSWAQVGQQFITLFTQLTSQQ